MVRLFRRRMARPGWYVDPFTGMIRLPRGVRFTGVGEHMKLQNKRKKLRGHHEN